MANKQDPDESVSAVKADQLRTQEDVYREAIGYEIVIIADRLREGREELDRLRTILKDAKHDVDEQLDDVKSLQDQLTQLALDMARVEDGTYLPTAKQQNLPFGAATTQRVATAADSAPLAELAKHGCPKGLLSALASSQLASERKLETVGDLLAAIQADDYWYKKIKGMGDERKDKLVDAITAWGIENNSASKDTRPKQCLDHDCQQCEDKGIFTKGDDGGEACPTCGNSKHWQRYEGDEPASEA